MKELQPNEQVSLTNGSKAKVIKELGRGLDMFEKYSPFSIEALRQDKRKCKEFMVTYMKTKNA